MGKFLNAITGPVAQCVYGLGALGAGTAGLVLGISSSDSMVKFARHCLAKSCNVDCNTIRNFQTFLGTAKGLSGTLLDVFVFSSAINDIFGSRLETTYQDIPEMSFKQRFFGTKARTVVTIVNSALFIAYPVFLGFSIVQDIRSGSCCSSKSSSAADCSELKKQAFGRSIGTVSSVYLSLAFSTALGASKIYQKLMGRSGETEPLVRM